jgi:hypothetical protein
MAIIRFCGSSGKISRFLFCKSLAITLSSSSSSCFWLLGALFLVQFVPFRLLTAVLYNIIEFVEHFKASEIVMSTSYKALVI